MVDFNINSKKFQNFFFPFELGTFVLATNNPNCLIRISTKGAFNFMINA